MSGQVVLVTGGARSGKSRFAEKYIHKNVGRTAYFATAQIFDDEMRERIRVHRQQRPGEWTTFETPFDAETQLARAADEFEFILFDCLTIYTSNLILSPAMPPERALRQKIILEKTGLLMDAAARGRAKVVFVTNEVGMSVVPENALAREFRDIAGLVNQQAARAAGEVYLVVCGVPLKIK